MKKLAILVAGATALMALPAIAGINPLDPGLPQGWISSVYGTNLVIGTATGTVDGTAATGKLSVVDSFSSAICVECHTRNPGAASRIQDPNGVALATDMGSHYVMSANGSTHSGGGFTGGFGNNFRTGGQYENSGLWVTAAQAGKGLSKYGSAATTYQNNDIINTDTTSTAGDMICESCHNVLVNNGNQLLLGTYSDAGTTATADQLCLECHGNGDDGATSATYADFHANGNLKNFNGTARKRHHVLSGDLLTAANYNPDNNVATNDSVMWAPNYTRELGSGLYNTWVLSTTVPYGAAFAFRNAVSVSGQGTLTTANNTADIGTGTAFRCNSCHRPHNAITTVGAFIFRKAVDASYVAGRALPADATGGLLRQHDVDSSYANKIYGEYNNLCKGCHTGYGN